ncbi:ethylbenzene dehydrogenase-related protein [Thalassotalea algicola]|uniref:ethylbenzene dehydrogenase-related protein n=1 Tax=Thalassotalea algicola TaxID=2716224 RepID=UPI0038B6A616
MRDKLTDEELETIEAPNPDYIREVPQLYKDGLARVEAKEAAEKAKKKEEAAAEKEKMQQKIEQAVEAALATSGGSASKESTSAPSSAAPSGESASFDVDWGKASSRDITLFYPGTASIEWILGRNHGGKRAFSKGDPCIECHEEEIADIGQLIVSGESEKELEPNLIPNKRGSIPVTIDATHDAENVYLKFSWPNTEHTPAPFVDGGKMDPANQIKLAYMIATDEVEFADRAGCWGSCHADANTMPFAPEKDALANSELASRLDLNNGVTKYIKESRTKLELKGRRGKALGGWDKLKSAEEITASVQAKQLFDLVRVKSGDSAVEDGYILDERKMHGGQGGQAVATLTGDTWTVTIKRPLVSDKEGDVTLEAGKVYNFGFAIHDDYTSARYHHVSFGYRLALDNEEAHINVTKQ